METIVKESLDASTRSWAVVLRVAEQFALWVATSGLRIVMILAIAWLAVAVIRRVTRRLHTLLVGEPASIDRGKRADTLVGIVQTTASILLFTAAGMMLLREIGLDIAPLLATAGIGGLAIGFGAQTLVKDVISGFFMLVEDHVRVGDIVDISGKAGKVEAISLRTIRLRDEDGDLHVIPHGAVAIVTNMTKDFSRYVLELAIPYKEDPRKVFDALREIAAELQKDPDFGPDIVKPLEILGVESVGRTLKVKARITTRPSRQWQVGRQLNLRLGTRLAREGIELQ